MLLASALMLPTPVRADDTALGKEMESIDSAFKAFRRETDPAKGAKAAREGQEAVLKSLPLVPAMIAKMPAGEAKDKAIAAYRLQMGQLFVVFCEVESAFIAKDIPTVTKLVETVKGSKKKGHDDFIEDEE
ncbi:cytochrome b562 [Luteolibacter flavescens]|uniref:Cytochrome b562 n=1 Tax=Luteolibacter flavescens TaxID=1859460 RepID=A0ABT3FMM3_9BACT|nr:cytochrome b562 [Luteolibacter flavescens]MCW1884822.1 cytochrome b562 [Luteolibacter flavescens]